MKMWKVLLPVAAILLLAGQAVAQTDKEERLREIEAREAEMERKMVEAERQMAEAARQIAEITRERLPQIAKIERRFDLMLGAGLVEEVMRLRANPRLDLAAPAMLWITDSRRRSLEMTASIRR